MIDLRSDTVTRPTAKMRAAMAAAEVGDDVYGEDPTVNRLEARAAEVFGREAALFVPTGTMGNQVAIRLHTQPGQEVVCEARAHVLDWEMGMAAVFSGCTLRPVWAERGILTWELVRGAIYRGCAVSCVDGIDLYREHAHGGGRDGDAGGDGARDLRGRACDGAAGASGWGAGVQRGGGAGGERARTDERVRYGDVLLVEGAGRAGGVDAGGHRRRRWRGRGCIRKSLGGGMRQAGVLAAAGLIALEEMPARLGEDHANARLLAEAVAGHDAAEIDLATVQTNMVIFKLRRGGDAAAFCAALKEKGVLAGGLGPRVVRFVTHFDVSREDCERAAGVVGEVLKGW